MMKDPIEHARQLISAGQYDEARRILTSYKDDPRAYGMLQTLDAIQQGGDFKRKNDQIHGGEPYQGGYQAYQQAEQYPPTYGGYVSPDPQQPQMYSGFVPVKSYTGIAIGVLLLYIFFWIAGFIVNIIMLNDASNNKHNPYIRVEGDGCLKSLFVVFGILPLIFFCGVMALVLTASSSTMSGF
ncbi:MAG: hypothetical protein Kow00117_21210 [Phototrophicales bacterium]